jgi:glycosyltransferase involved in cell wall biosynthesis
VGISVVICTYGLERFDDVLEAVNSLNNQDYQDFEILIVIDKNDILQNKLKNNLSDDIKIIVSDKKGLSNARNEGIKRSKNEIIAFLDDDAIANKDWLTTIDDNFKNEKVVVVGGKIKPYWINERPVWFPEEVDWIVGCTYKGHPEKKGSIRNVIGCNMAFRRSAFDMVGLFETNVGRVGKKLLAGEEMEICVRIKKAMPNSLIIYDPKMEVHHKVHPYRQTINYVRKRAYNEGLSKARIAKLFEKGNENEFVTENQYIDYLMKRAIPLRIKNVITMQHAFENMAKTLTIIYVILAVTVGYSSKYRRG